MTLKPIWDQVSYRSSRFRNSLRYVASLIYWQWLFSRRRMHCDRVSDPPRDLSQSRASEHDDREARYWTRKLYEFEAKDPDRYTANKLSAQYVVNHLGRSRWVANLEEARKEGNEVFSVNLISQTVKNTTTILNARRLKNYCFFILHFHATGGDTVASRSFIRRSLKVTGKQKFSPTSYKQDSRLEKHAFLDSFSGSIS